jgi:hypothetical protein
MTATTTPLARTHVERFTALATGKTIAVSCGCAIGRDHIYAEWIAMSHDKRRPATRAA